MEVTVHIDLLVLTKHEINETYRYWVYGGGGGIRRRKKTQKSGETHDDGKKNSFLPNHR